MRHNEQIRCCCSTCSQELDGYRPHFTLQVLLNDSRCVFTVVLLSKIKNKNSSWTSGTSEYLRGLRVWCCCRRLSAAPRPAAAAAATAAGHNDAGFVGRLRNVQLSVRVFLRRLVGVALSVAPGLAVTLGLLCRLCGLPAAGLRAALVRLLLLFVLLGLSLFGVSPLHASVLKPHLHLQTHRNTVRSHCLCHIQLQTFHIVHVFNFLKFPGKNKQCLMNKIGLIIGNIIPE